MLVRPKKDAIRKLAHRRFADIFENHHVAFRVGCDFVENSLDIGRELVAKSRALIFVEQESFLKLVSCLVAQNDRQSHRFLIART